MSEIVIDDVDVYAKLVLEAIAGGNAALGISAGLVVLMNLLRWALGKAGDKSPAWLRTIASNPIVLWALPTVMSAAAALVTSLVAGVPVTLGLVLKAVLVGLSANGLFNGKKKLDEVRAPKDNIEAAAMLEASLKPEEPKPGQKGPQP